MTLLDDEIKKFVGEQAELGCWNQDFEYRLRRALIRYHTIKSKELRERVKELEGTIAGHKECFEKFLPEDKWDEATTFLSSYGNGLAKDFQLKENQ